MHRTLLGCLLFLGISGALSGAEVQGVIADWRCVKPMVRDGREKTLRRDHSCSLVKDFNRSAFGLITDDKKYYRLQDPGNEHILELLKNTPDKDNLKVVVTGDIQGDTITVANISML